MQRRGRALYPADGLAEEQLEALPQNVDLKCKVTRPRSHPQHRLYFAMLNLVAQNNDYITDAEQLHQVVKFRLGYSRNVQLTDGSVCTLHGSVAFDKMDGAAFNEFMDKATAFLCDEIIPNLGKAELIAQAREMLGLGA